MVPSKYYINMRAAGKFRLGYFMLVLVRLGSSRLSCHRVRSADIMAAFTSNNLSPLNILTAVTIK